MTEPGNGRRAVVATVAAAVLVGVALLVPNIVTRPVPTAVVSVPLEGLLAAVALIVVPDRARRGLATGLGVLLGLVTVGKLVDLGFFAALAQPFDLLFDWSLFGNGYEYLRGSLGPGGAIAAVALAAVIATGVIWSLTWAVRRLARVIGPRPGAVAGLAVPLVVVVLLSVTGIVPMNGVTVAAGRIQDVRDSLADHDRFAAELAADPYAATPPDQLLTALRGRDVVLTLVESYGRDAIENPALAGPIRRLLDDGTRRLGSAGFQSRSAYLTSSTFGGGSWLAHGSLLSGTWVDSQRRYRQLVSSDRLTLNRAFGRAGWRTVGLSPGTTKDWPEQAFFGFDRFYDSHALGYRGPNFSWATMPDQYTLAAFERLERGRPDRPPVMAEVQFVSSHAPWSPIPELLDWSAIGDGSVYDGTAEVDEPPSAILTRDPYRVRADYVASVGYALRSLISYVETYGDRNLVLIFLGDHQPNAIVTGDAASHDVPITIVAADPAVLDRIDDWGWSPGLRPSPDAPVWRMDAFRNRFLAAYGSTPASALGPR